MRRAPLGPILTQLGLERLKRWGGGKGGTSQPGVSRAGTLDFGGIEFQSPLVSIQRGVIALESWWCAELLFALFLLSWMSKGVRGKGEVTS